MQHAEQWMLQPGELPTGDKPARQPSGLYPPKNPSNHPTIVFHNGTLSHPRYILFSSPLPIQADDNLLLLHLLATLPLGLK